MSYTGETAYITGGASGIARSLAETLVSKGMKIVIADRNLSGAEQTIKDLNKNEHVAWAVQVDVSDWESQRKGFEYAISKLNRINYVFPIAGIGEGPKPWTPKRPGATDFEKPNLAVLDVNGTGAFYSASLAIQHFRRQEADVNGYRGKIVIVASSCGFYSIPGLPIYTASKHAVVGFVRTFGKHLPQEEITLNAICPNLVKTNISSQEFYDKASAKGLLISEHVLIEAFESLLGGSDTSGEAIEILPGSDGYRIKEKPGYTNQKCEETADIIQVRSNMAYERESQG